MLIESEKIPRSSKKEQQLGDCQIFLEDKFIDVDEKDILSLVDDAKDLIVLGSSSWVPVEKQAIGLSHGHGQEASYVGKWNDRHNILLGISGKKDLDSPQTRFYSVCQLAHEMMHQKTAEVLPTGNMLGSTIEKRLHNPQFTSASELTQMFMIKCGRHDITDLQHLISEGIVLYMEDVMLHKKLLDPRLTVDQRAVIEELFEMRRGERESARQAANAYRISYSFVSKLLIEIPHADILQLLPYVDWEACHNISKDSPEYIEILQDPKRIPGLSRFLSL